MTRLWDVGTGELKLTLPNTGSSGFSIAYSPDGKMLATGGRRIQLWNAKTGEKIQTFEQHSTKFEVVKSIISLGQNSHSLDRHEDAADFIAYSPDGKTLAGVGDDDRIRLWDVKTGKLKRIYSGHKWSVKSIAFSPDSKTLASGSSDGTILLWEVPQ